MARGREERIARFGHPGAGGGGGGETTGSTRWNSGRARSNVADERESYHKRFFPPLPSTHLSGPVSGAADWRRRRYFRGVGQWQRSRPNQYLCGETPGGPQIPNTSADLGPGSHATISFTRYCMARFAAIDFFPPPHLLFSVRPSVRSFHATRFTCLPA